MRVSEEDPPPVAMAHGALLATKQLPALLDNIGPGWWALVMVLHQKLMDVFPSYQVSDLKEKFGGLRVYLEHYDGRLQALIDASENLSFQVCEKCGAPGALRVDRNWFRTLCDTCDPLRRE